MSYPLKRPPLVPSIAAKKIQTTVYLTLRQVEQLGQVSRLTDKPQAAIIRAAIDTQLKMELEKLHREGFL